MDKISIDILRCEDCVFHHIVQTTDGIRHQCNYYHNLLCELGLSAKEKHPDCKVVSVFVNEER